MSLFIALTANKPVDENVSENVERVAAEMIHIRLITTDNFQLSRGLE